MSQKYLTPDYYPEFLCKMGACRSACCEGWPISVSLADYFKLLGVECSPGLRRRLDCAMHLSDHPSPEAYAQISPRYDGNCPMRMADGRCALQAELGEDALAAVCRLYPRGVRTNGVRECSCANSCEAVLELFLNRTAPIVFRETELSFVLPETPADENAAHKQRIRLWCIARLQERAYPLPERIVWMGFSLLAMEEAFRAQDTRRMESLLSGAETVPVPEPIQTGGEPLALGLELANHMLQILDERSGSIRSYGESELNYFGNGAEERRKYMQACKRFEQSLPGWEVWFEHMLVNHIFFTQFPFQNEPAAMGDEFLGICCVYALLRFLCVGWAAQHDGAEAVVDVAAMAFRLIDHTDFERTAARIVKDLGYNKQPYLCQFLRL